MRGSSPARQRDTAWPLGQTGQTSNNSNKVSFQVPKMIIEKRKLNFALEETGDGSYRDISNALLLRGWNKVPYRKRSKMEKKRPGFVMKDTPLMIWTLNDKDIEYGDLQSNQVCNHFEGISALTTKRGFCDILREVMGPQIGACPHSISLRCYNLGDPVHRDEFVDDFRICACINLLKWVVLTSIQKHHDPASDRKENNSEKEKAVSSSSSQSAVPEKETLHHGAVRVPIKVVRLAMKAISAYLQIHLHGDWPHTGGSAGIAPFECDEVEVGTTGASERKEDRDAGKEKEKDSNQSKPQLYNGSSLGTGRDRAQNGVKAQINVYGLSEKEDWSQVLQASYAVAEAVSGGVSGASGSIIGADLYHSDMSALVALACEREKERPAPLPSPSDSSGSACSSSASDPYDYRSFYGSFTVGAPSFLRAALLLQAISDDATLGRRAIQFDLSSGLKNVWCVKAPEASCGTGLKLYYRLEEILGSERGIGGRTVQKYLEQPLLMGGHTNTNTPTQPEASIRVPRPLSLFGNGSVNSNINSSGGKKFDLRVWVLVTQMAPTLEAYVFSRTYGRQCSAPYSLSVGASASTGSGGAGSGNLDNNFVHFTNYSVQKHSIGGKDSGKDSSASASKTNTNTNSNTDSNIDSQSAIEKEDFGTFIASSVKSIRKAVHNVRTVSAATASAVDNFIAISTFDLTDAGTTKKGGDPTSTSTSISEEEPTGNAMNSNSNQGQAAADSSSGSSRVGDLLLPHSEVVGCLEQAKPSSSSSAYNNDSYNSNNINENENNNSHWETRVWPLIQAKILLTLQAGRVRILGGEGPSEGAGSDNTADPAVLNAGQKYKAFEFLGFDVIMDERTVTPYILEVNLSPAIARRTQEHNQMVAHMSQGLVDLAVLPHVRTADENAKEEESALVREFLSPRGGSPRDLTHLLKGTSAALSSSSATGVGGLGEWVKLEKKNIGLAGRVMLESAQIQTQTQADALKDGNAAYNLPSSAQIRMTTAQHSDWTVQNAQQQERGRPSSRGVGLTGGNGNGTERSSSRGSSKQRRPSSAGPLGRRRAQESASAYGQGYPGFGAAPPLPSVQPASERELGLEIGYALCGRGISIGGIMHQDSILTRLKSVLLLQRWAKRYLLRTYLFHTARKAAALVCQSAALCFLRGCRVFHKRRYLSAVFLQKRIRVLLAQLLLARLRNARAATRIQCTARCRSARKVCRMLCLQNKARFMQRWYRDRKSIQKLKTVYFLVNHVRKWFQRRLRKRNIVKHLLKLYVYRCRRSREYLRQSLLEYVFQKRERLRVKKFMKKRLADECAEASRIRVLRMLELRRLEEERYTENLVAVVETMLTEEMFGIRRNKGERAVDGGAWQGQGSPKFVVGAVKDGEWISTDMRALSELCFKECKDEQWREEKHQLELIALKKREQEMLREIEIASGPLKTGGARGTIFSSKRSSSNHPPNSSGIGMPQMQTQAQRLKKKKGINEDMLSRYDNSLFQYYDMDLQRRVLLARAHAVLQAPDYHLYAEHLSALQEQEQRVVPHFSANNNPANPVPGRNSSVSGNTSSPKRPPRPPISGHGAGQEAELPNGLCLPRAELEDYRAHVRAVHQQQQYERQQRQKQQQGNPNADVVEGDGGEYEPNLNVLLEREIGPISRPSEEQSRCEGMSRPHYGSHIAAIASTMEDRHQRRVQDARNLVAQSTKHTHINAPAAVGGGSVEGQRNRGRSADTAALFRGRGTNIEDPRTQIGPTATPGTKRSGSSSGKREKRGASKSKDRVRGKGNGKGSQNQRKEKERLVGRGGRENENEPWKANETDVDVDYGYGDNVDFGAYGWEGVDALQEDEEEDDSWMGFLNTNENSKEPASHARKQGKKKVRKGVYGSSGSGSRSGAKGSANANANANANSSSGWDGFDSFIIDANPGNGNGNTEIKNRHASTNKNKNKAYRDRGVSGEELGEGNKHGNLTVAPGEDDRQLLDDRNQMLHSMLANLGFGQ